MVLHNKKFIETLGDRIEILCKTVILNSCSPDICVKYQKRNFILMD